MRTAQIIVAAAGINTDGIINFIAQAIVPVILAILGVAIMAGAKRGRISEGANTITIVMMGAVLLLGAGAFMQFGDNLVGVIFN